MVVQPPKEVAAELPVSDPLETLNDTARRIVETTRRLLVDRGYSYLSIENIANECQLNKTAIRYYFGNKAGLIELVVDSWIHDNNRRLLSLFSIPSEPVLRDKDSLRAFMRAKLEMIKDTETYVAFFELIPAATRDGRNSSRLEEMYEFATRVYARLFASSLPGLDDDQVRGFAQLLFAVVDGLGAQRMISPERFPPDAALDLLAQILTTWACSRAADGV